MFFGLLLARNVISRRPATSPTHLVLRLSHSRMKHLCIPFNRLAWQLTRETQKSCQTLQFSFDHFRVCVAARTENSKLVLRTRGSIISLNQPRKNINISG